MTDLDYVELAALRARDRAASMSYGVRNDAVLLVLRMLTEELGRATSERIARRDAPEV